MMRSVRKRGRPNVIPAGATRSSRVVMCRVPRVMVAHCDLIPGVVMSPTYRFEVSAIRPI